MSTTPAPVPAIIPDKSAVVACSDKMGTAISAVLAIGIAYVLAFGVVGPRIFPSSLLIVMKALFSFTLNTLESIYGLLALWVVGGLVVADVSKDDSSFSAAMLDGVIPTSMQGLYSPDVICTLLWVMTGTVVLSWGLRSADLAMVTYRRISPKVMELKL